MIPKKKSQVILERFHKAREQRQKYNDKWNMLDMFYRGDQYQLEKLPPWIPKPSTNFVHLTVTTKRAALAMENPTGLLSANSVTDVPQIEKLQMLYEWVWEKVNARKVVRENIETAKLLGTGIAYIYWHENTGVRGGTDAYYEGEICVKSINPANFFPDPQASCLEDCEYVHVVDLVTRKWVEETFNVTLKKEHVDHSSPDTEIYQRDRHYDTSGRMVELHTHYERYWNTETLKVKAPIMGEMPATIMGDTGQEFEDPSGYMQEGEVGQQEIDTGEEIGGWAYRVHYMVGDQIVHTVDKLQPNMYPFAILYDFKHTQEFWGKSTAELIIENQKLVNKVESIMAMIGTMLQNPQKLVAKGSGINPRKARDYSTAPGMVWEVNNGIPLDQAMKWQDVPQIPQALFNLAESAKANIREITGLNEAYMGQSVGSLQTSSGVDSLIDRATLRDRDQMFDIEMYIEQLSRLLIAYMTTYYTEKRWAKVITDPTKPNDAEFVSFIGRDYQDIEFDFHIDVSSKAPVSVMKRKQEAKELLELQGQYGLSPRVITPQEYIMMSDFVNKREIIDRMNKEEQFSMTQKIQKAAEMALEAVMSGVDPAQAADGAVQQVMQMAAEGATNPLNPDNIPSNVGGAGSGSPIVNAPQPQQAVAPPTAGY